MKLKLFLLVYIMFLVSCAQTEHKNIKNTSITFGDVVDLSKLEKVTMHNNSGTFVLNTKQMEKLKGELSKMEYEKDLTVKLGSIYIELIIDGKKCGISSRTHANYIEVHKNSLTETKDLSADRDWFYFKTNGVNFDNYKKQI
ncbi:MAG: hypothetical protein AAF611_21515 [Bacteroidota bacterium]